MSAASEVMDQLVGLPERPNPTMGNLAKVSYTHKDMIDYILLHPGCSLQELAARYGYSTGWICNVQASDAWKSAFEKRREELADPIIIAGIKERFEGMTMLSLERLRQKLEAPQVSDNVVLKAVELGAKAMGVGGNAVPPPPPADHLAALAERLIALQNRVRAGTLISGETYDGQAEQVGA